MSSQLPLLAFLALTVSALAQAPAFDVASVKANRTGSNMSTGSGLRNGRYTVENATLRSLFQTAFAMPRTRILGPDWMDNERFDIQAKAPAGTPDHQLAAMLQTLLADRFHAATHGDTREMPAFDMVVAKGGLKIRKYDPAQPQPRLERAAFAGVGTMAALADQLARAAGQPVIDRTGVDGLYAYALSYATLSSRSADPEAPDLFLAVEQQLGVKLVARKQPIEVLVVDRVERPTEN